MKGVKHRGRRRSLTRKIRIRREQPSSPRPMLRAGRNSLAGIVRSGLTRLNRNSRQRGTPGDRMRLLLSRSNGRRIRLQHGLGGNASHRSHNRGQRHKAPTGGICRDARRISSAQSRENGVARRAAGHHGAPRGLRWSYAGRSSHPARRGAPAADTAARRGADRKAHRGAGTTADEVLRVRHHAIRGLTSGDSFGGVNGQQGSRACRGKRDSPAFF
jgi:hypothetical protein